MSSRSSPECSPHCQCGDQGFKSPRGRFFTTQRRGTQSGKATSTNDAFLTSSSVPETFVILWVRLPLASMNSHALAEHWRAQVAVTHPPSGFGGSTPSRRTDNLLATWSEKYSFVWSSVVIWSKRQFLHRRSEPVVQRQIRRPAPANGRGRE